MSHIDKIEMKAYEFGSHSVCVRLFNSARSICSCSPYRPSTFGSTSQFCVLNQKKKPHASEPANQFPLSSVKLTACELPPPNSIWQKNCYFVYHSGVARPVVVVPTCNLQITCSSLQTARD